MVRTLIKVVWSGPIQKIVMIDLWRTTVDHPQFYLYIRLFTKVEREGGSNLLRTVPPE
jgi:hypothetical protein